MTGWREAWTLGVLGLAIGCAATWAAAALFAMTSRVATDTERAEEGCALVGFLVITLLCLLALGMVAL